MRLDEDDDDIGAPDTRVGFAAAKRTAATAWGCV